VERWREQSTFVLMRLAVQQEQRVAAGYGLQQAVHLASMTGGTVHPEQGADRFGVGQVHDRADGRQLETEDPPVTTVAGRYKPQRRNEEQHSLHGWGPKRAWQPTARQHQSPPTTRSAGS
jgi:hypothetical protein